MKVQLKMFYFATVLATLMSGRKYDVIPQNGDCSRESNVHTVIVFRRDSPGKAAQWMGRSIHES
jgi:hypothetical protein